MLSKRPKREDSRMKNLIEEAEIEPKMIKHLEIRKNLQSGAIGTTVKILVKRISQIDQRERRDLVGMNNQEEMSHQEEMNHQEETKLQKEMNTQEEMNLLEEKRMIIKEEMMRVFQTLDTKREIERMSE
jgi:hypothetical protein